MLPIESAMWPPGRDARSNIVIHFDLACARCGYNLRTLTIAHQCTECGWPVVQTMADALVCSAALRRKVADVAGHTQVFTLAFLGFLVLFAALVAPMLPMSDLLIGLTVGAAVVTWFCLVASTIILASVLKPVRQTALLSGDDSAIRGERPARIACSAVSAMLVLALGPPAIFLVPFSLLLLVWRIQAGYARLIATTLHRVRLRSFADFACRALTVSALGLMASLAAIYLATTNTVWFAPGGGTILLVIGLIILVSLGGLTAVLMLETGRVLRLYESPLASPDDTDSTPPPTASEPTDSPDQA